MKRKKCIVIGSGPSGVSVASVLLNKKKHVMMLDVGYELENTRAEVVEKLKTKKYEDWSMEDIEFLKEGSSANVTGVESKKLFGSDFAERSITYAPVEFHNSKMYLSYAKGGLSNIWGRGIESSLSGDISDWPVQENELRAYYQQIYRIVNLACLDDDLDKIIPMDCENKNQYRLSRQAKYYIKKYMKNRKQLNNKGYYAGTLRLAADFHVSGKKECEYCGMCVYGCPYGLLYSSSSTVDLFRKKYQNFEYKAGFYVKKIIEKKGKITVNTIDIKSGKEVLFSGEKVYLAAGPINSTRILMESLGIVNQMIKMQTSDLIIIPSVLTKLMHGIQNERMIATGQTAAFIKDDSISKYGIAMHNFFYNDMYSNILKVLTGRFYNILKFPINIFLGSFFVSFVFIHSNDSSELKLILDEKGVLKVFGEINEKKNFIEKQLKKKLMKMSLYTGHVPIPFYYVNTLPGSSIHNGGSFPMSTNPSDFNTDVYGTPRGFTKLHIVDSSVLPSIPGGSFTFLVMANAMRIADNT